MANDGRFSQVRLDIEYQPVVSEAVSAVQLGIEYQPAVSGAISANGLMIEYSDAFSGIDSVLLMIEYSDVPNFPPQFPGLRTFYGGSVVELCLVAEEHAPAGMGGVLLLDKGGTRYAVYLVEPTDPQASAVRVQTTAGVKAIRLKT